MTKLIHTFASTGRAYDATQCDETILNGQTLFIPSEGVVGLAETWPVAVTAEIGDLHGLKPGRLADAQFLADRKITAEQVRAAVALAMGHGFEIDPAFAAYKGE